MDRDIPLPDTEFWNAYQGRFQGILTWPAFDRLWALLEAAPEGWHVFELAGSAPDAPVDAQAFRAVLAEASEMYAIARKSSLCGTVYVDDPAAPQFLKVFDPANMGAVCGDSGQRTLPRWTFTKLRPDPLPEAAPQAGRKGLFARLTGG